MTTSVQNGIVGVDTVRLSVELAGSPVFGVGWKVSERVTETGTSDVAALRLLESSGARAQVMAGRLYLECSVPKVLSGEARSNVRPATAGELHGLVPDLLGEARAALGGVELLPAVRVNRLDAVRDFEGCEFVGALIQAIGQAPTAGRMVRAVYADPGSGGAQTVFTRSGGKTGVGARLYDKGAESGDVAAGTVRFEAQERRPSLERFQAARLADVGGPAILGAVGRPESLQSGRGPRWLRPAGRASVPDGFRPAGDAQVLGEAGIEIPPVRVMLADVDDDLVADLARARFEWSGYGRPVRPVSELVRAVLAARACHDGCRWVERPAKGPGLLPPAPVWVHDDLCVALTEGQALQAIGYAAALAAGLGDEAAGEKSRRSRVRAYLRTAGVGGQAPADLDGAAVEAFTTGRAVRLDFDAGYRNVA